jgi:hypothetical protein
MELDKPRQTSAFLEKLYEILDLPDYREYIDWQPDGKSFLIKEVEKFSKYVLPKYYKHNNFQSFVRQLNMYSFSKTRHDANWREFKQEYFMKKRRDLLPLIKRKTQLSQYNATQEKESTSGTGGNSFHSNGETISSRRRSGNEVQTCCCTTEVVALKKRVEQLENQLWFMDQQVDKLDRAQQRQQVENDMIYGLSRTILPTLPPHDHASSSSGETTHAIDLDSDSSIQERVQQSRTLSIDSTISNVIDGTFESTEVKEKGLNAIASLASTIIETRHTKYQLLGLSEPFKHPVEDDKIHAANSLIEVGRIEENKNVSMTTTAVNAIETGSFDPGPSPRKKLRVPVYN